MRAELQVKREWPTEIGGQPSTPADSFVRAPTRINGDRISFRDLAKFAWPNKTAENLSYLSKYDARTCRRWLANQTEPPAEALSIILCEIMRQYRGK